MAALLDGRCLYYFAMLRAVNEDMRSAPPPACDPTGGRAACGRGEGSRTEEGESGMSTTLTPIGSTFRTGEKNPVSGVFACVRCENAGRANTIPLSKGETFPPCSKCSSGVTWRLVRYA